MKKERILTPMPHERRMLAAIVKAPGAKPRLTIIANMQDAIDSIITGVYSIEERDGNMFMSGSNGTMLVLGYNKRKGVYTDVNNPRGVCADLSEVK